MIQSKRQGVGPQGGKGASDFLINKVALQVLAGAAKVQSLAQHLEHSQGATHAVSALHPSRAYTAAAACTRTYGWQGHPLAVLQEAQPVGHGHYDVGGVACKKRGTSCRVLECASINRCIWQLHMGCNGLGAGMHKRYVGDTGSTTWLHAPKEQIHIG